ncbi:MAG: hypothetical protein AW10_02069 [Candidatus Accumulibacter appositus]|uniref:Uncharacterized protein n=1 Tax=Candidatus Accumulibacter appositus TaxID=1454003 RepID=A0A011QM47_9PROT|nr:MAG: hypothetical protein AW10_02069 [Candidatus Accumulibacter appositus]
MLPSVAVASAIDSVGKVGIVSLSIMVPVAMARVIVALLAPLRVTMKSSVASGRRSSVTSSVMVLLVSLAAKLSVPVSASMLSL